MVSFPLEETRIWTCSLHSGRSAAAPEPGNYEHASFLQATQAASARGDRAASLIALAVCSCSLIGEKPQTHSS
jgi:hypothetical protein